MTLQEEFLIICRTVNAEPLHHWYSIGWHNNHIKRIKSVHFKAICYHYIQEHTISCFTALLYSQCNNNTVFVAPYFSHFYIIWKLRAKPLTWNNLWFHPDQAEVGFIPTAPIGDTKFLMWNKIRWKDYVCMFCSQVWQQTGQVRSALNSWINVTADCLDTRALAFSPTQLHRFLKIICLYTEIHSCHIQYRNKLWVSHRQKLPQASLMFNRLVKLI